MARRIEMLQRPCNPTQRPTQRITQVTRMRLDFVQLRTSGLQRCFYRIQTILQIVNPLRLSINEAVCGGGAGFVTSPRFAYCGDS